MTYNPSLSLTRKATGPVRVAVVADEPAARAELLPMLGNVGLSVVEPGQAEVFLWDPGHDHDLVAKRLARLAHMDVPVVVVLDDASLASEALARRARGIILREHIGDGVVAALQAAAYGLTVLDPDIATHTTAHAEARPKHDSAKEKDLTDRESQVVELLAEGMSNKLIASRLGISDHTAKFHVTGVMSKLGATSRTEAVVEAVRRGLVNL